MKRVIITAIALMALMFDNAGAQKWMQYGQMYPVGRNTSKMRLPNGTDQYFISDGHNYFDAESGAWKRHTFQFVPLGDGRYMYQADYDFITGKYYADEFIMAHNNIWLSWSPIGANVSQVQIKGDTAYYNGVYTQVKAARLITSEGIKEYLRAGTIAARDSFEYIYRTNASKIKKDSLNFYLYDDDNVLQLVVPKIDYWDANGLTRQGEYKWKRQGAGAYYVTMKVDYDGMTFPVIIDPTTALTDTSLMKDGQISSQSHATKGTPYGAATTMNLLNQAGDLRRVIQYWDMSAVAANTVIDWKDTLNTSTNSWTIAPANWRIVWYPLKRSFYETTFNWFRRNNTSADSTWINEGIVPNNRVTTDIDTTLKAKFKAYKPGTTGAFVMNSDSADISPKAMFEAWLTGALTNNGMIMMFDSAGYDSVRLGTSYAQITFESKEGATKPRLWLTTIQVTPCTLSVVDTNAVSATIDTINGNLGSSIVVSVYNATYGKYYAFKSTGPVVLADTLFTSARGNWSNKRIPLKPNSDNFFLTVSWESGIAYDSTVQIQRVGNPSAISILDAGDTLFFRLYDNQGNFKWFRVDSLIQQSRMERYTYNSPVFAFAFADRWREYAWRRMQEKIEQWN